MSDSIYIYDYTPLVKVSDKTYPVYFPTVRKENPNTSFPVPIRIDILEPFGYAPVLSTDKPDGDVVTEGVPELKDDGYWYQTWTTRNYTDSELKELLEGQQLSARFNAPEVLRADRDNGLLYKDGATISVSESGLSALLLLKEYSALNPDATISIGTIEGPILELSSEEFSSLYSQIIGQYYSLIQNYWKYLEKVAAATSINDFSDQVATFLE